MSEFWDIVGTESIRLTGEQLERLSRLRGDRLAWELEDFSPEERRRIEQAIYLLAQARNETRYA